jgi:hypothetical protein
LKKVERVEGVEEVEEEIRGKGERENCIPRIPSREGLGVGFKF